MIALTNNQNNNDVNGYTVRKFSAFLLFLVFILVNADYLEAQHKFKVYPNKIIQNVKDPERPQIVWTDSKYAVVYDNQKWSKKNCGIYLIFINREGKVVSGPIEISSEKFALYPKIVWTGKTIGILYAGGRTKKNNNYNLKTYLLLCNSTGNIINKKSLPGKMTHYNPAYHAKLLWTENQFAIFYNTIPPGKNETVPAYITADINGDPGSIIQTYDDNNCGPFDVIWNGKDYVILAARRAYSWFSPYIAQIIILDTEGELVNRKDVIDFGNIGHFSTTSITKTKSQSGYIIALGGYYPNANKMAQDEKDSEIYASDLTINNKKISDFKPKIVTKNQNIGWRMPSLLSVGNKNYLLCAQGNRCSISFTQVNPKGELIAKPLIFDIGGCQIPPPSFAVLNNNEVGVVFSYIDLYFGIIDLSD